MVPRPPWDCCWEEELLPASTPGRWWALHRPWLLRRDLMSIFQGWRSTILDEEMFLEIPSSPGFPWVHQPATARGRNRVQKERSCVGFQLGREREVLSSPPAFQSQARARSLQTSVHERAGGPLCSLLDISDLPRFQQPISSPFRSLRWLLAMFPMEKPLWSCSWLQWGACEGALPTVLGAGAGWGGKHLVSSQHVQLTAQGVQSSSSTTSSSSSSNPAPTEVTCW